MRNNQKGDSGNLMGNHEPCIQLSFTFVYDFDNSYAEWHVWACVFISYVCLTEQTFPQRPEGLGSPKSKNHSLFLQIKPSIYICIYKVRYCRYLYTHVKIPYTIHIFTHMAMMTATVETTSCYASSVLAIICYVCMRDKLRF